MDTRGPIRPSEIHMSTSGPNPTVPAPLRASPAAIDREQRAWLLFGAALVVVAAALLALVAVWLIQSSRTRLALGERDRLEAELASAREERSAIVGHAHRSGEEAEESALRAAEASRIAGAAEDERLRVEARLGSIEARLAQLTESIADPTDLPVARLADLLGPEPALELHVFLESDPPSDRLSDATLEAAVRELVPSKRFSLTDDADHVIVLSVIHERSGTDSILSLMLCVERPWFAAEPSEPRAPESPDAAENPRAPSAPDDGPVRGRQAWVRLWCRHTLGFGPTESLPALSRGLVNELLDLLSSEFAPRAEIPAEVPSLGNSPSRPADSVP